MGSREDGRKEWKTVGTTIYRSTIEEKDLKTSKKCLLTVNDIKKEPQLQWLGEMENSCNFAIPIGGGEFRVFLPSHLGHSY